MDSFPECNLLGDENYDLSHEYIHLITGINIARGPYSKWCTYTFLLLPYVERVANININQMFLSQFFGPYRNNGPKIDQREHVLAKYTYQLPVERGQSRAWEIGKPKTVAWNLNSTLTLKELYEARIDGRLYFPLML